MRAVDHELLSRLLDEHGAALVLYAQQWCSSPEDVVQESFLRLMRERPVPEKVVGWLYRVVRNRAIDASRAESRRSRYERLADDLREPWFDAAGETQIDASSAADCLGLLPTELREAIVLRLWGGHTYEQIAELTETSTSTAQRRFESGLAALRDNLGIDCAKKGVQR